MRGRRLNSGYSFNTDQRRTQAGTIPASKHFMERNLGEFGSDVLWTPAQISTALWLDAADETTITLNGSTVSQWNDKSGNGRHAVQGTAGKQPTRVLSGLNGKTILRFDGINDGSIMTTTWNLTDSHSIFLVAKKSTQTSDAASGIRPLVASTTSGGRLIAGIGTFRVGLSAPLINSADFLLDDTRITPIRNSWLDNVVRLLNYTYNGTTMNGWLDGSTFSTPLTASFSTFGAINIGGIDDNTARRFAGDLAETIIVSSVTSTTDRQLIEGYLAHKWGLQANLPIGHPYKSVAP